MKRLEVDFLLTCNANMEIIPNGAIVFDKTIVALGSQREMQTRFPDAEPISTSPGSVALPGLINPHVHLEFSANQGVLQFGSFVPWLQSVIAHREALQEAATSAVIEDTLAHMVASGTTTLGAISSFGLELDACAASPARVVFFTELLGSRPDAVDVLFEDFKHRLHCVYDKENARFTPALSIHSPYSTHPILAKNALDIARKENLLVSTHFMESFAERQWIDSGSGEFADFFNAFSPYAKPLSTGESYLELFKGTRTLFTHAVHASSQELAMIQALGASITHCPTSNRLLGTGVLDIDAVRAHGIPLTLGTDGLSSNISLSLWDEMRAALFCHAHKEPNALAQTLLEAATRQGGEALGLNVGTLEADKEADIIVMEADGATPENLPLHLLLHATTPSHIFIQGEPL